jgi:iron-sulfur cluster assembly protein
MIQISQTAANKIRSLKSEEGQPEKAFLRIDVKKGGCSGLSYKMNFDSELKETDKAFDAFGERVVVDNNSFLYLIGMTLDFSGGLNGKGFVFSNPNAKKTCGCGVSFNI